MVKHALRSRRRRSARTVGSLWTSRPEVALFRQRGSIPAGTSAGITPVTLGMPSGRGYRPIAVRYQITTAGDLPGVLQILFLQGREHNSPLGIREHLVPPNTSKGGSFRFPGSSPWLADGERSQNILELDHVCVDPKTGYMFYLIEIMFHLTTPTFTETCPTVNRKEVSPPTD